MDLTTTYLGLKLQSPLITGSCPLSDDNDMVRKLVDHGVSGIVMHSIYQEQLASPGPGGFWIEGRYGETAGRESHSGQRFVFTPHQYLQRIDTLKSIVKVPVIASLNVASPGTWAAYASQIQSAGADALELNAYFLPTDAAQSGADVENRLLDMVCAVRAQVQIPLAIKLSPHYSSLPHLAQQIQKAGASGLVLFNRFYQPDVDVPHKATADRLDLSHMSDPTELRLRLRWLAILSPQTNLSLALSGGVHAGLDAIKGIMAGAHVVQVVSALLSAGPEYLDTIRDGLTHYMQDLGATSIQNLRGCMDYRKRSDASTAERNSYLAILHKWGEKSAAPEGMHAY